MPPPAVSLPRLALPYAESEAESETEADAETDAETESDAETDAETEAETEGDAETGAATPGHQAVGAELASARPEARDPARPALEDVVRVPVEAEPEPGQQRPDLGAWVERGQLEEAEPPQEERPRRERRLEPEAG